MPNKVLKVASPHLSSFLNYLENSWGGGGRICSPLPRRRGTYERFLKTPQSVSNIFKIHLRAVCCFVRFPCRYYMAKVWGQIPENSTGDFPSGPVGPTPARNPSRLKHFDQRRPRFPIRGSSTALALSKPGKCPGSAFPTKIHYAHSDGISDTRISSERRFKIQV